MDVEFSDILPENLVSQPVCISGITSYNFPNVKYLLVAENGNYSRSFEIEYEYHNSPFEQAVIYGHILAAGYEEHFYLFDMFTNKIILVLKMEWYFGHFYIYDNDFFVADAAGLYRINAAGEILWHNQQLGIDGVIVQNFENGKISGSGEWDPPGGWRDFLLDVKTGRSLSRL